MTWCEPAPVATELGPRSNGFLWLARCTLEPSPRQVPQCRDQAAEVHAPSPEDGRTANTGSSRAMHKIKIPEDGAV